MSHLLNALRTFAIHHQFTRKGPLCVALVVTQHARRMGLPLDPDALITDGGGQVLGLGKHAVQAILGRHGITRVLAAEGGRTSRGSIANMRDYVRFLNHQAAQRVVDLDLIEAFWIDQIREFFAAKPFRIHLDVSRGLRTLVRDVLAQAEDRQKTHPHTAYVGTVLQHLVGAKLDCALGRGHLTHNSASSADAASGRDGDFRIGDVAIHVTAAPTEALIRRCQDNLDHGLRPIIVTTSRGLDVADGLARNANLNERIDLFEIEQFVALNLYELGKFAPEGRLVAVSDIVHRYNEIVEDVETDPSLRIEIRRPADRHRPGQPATRPARPANAEPIRHTSS